MFASLFRKRTLQSSGVFQGMTDCHSHILPGVDDGIRRLEDSLAVLEFYETLGMREVWCTPHIMEDMPNRTSDLRKRFETLKIAYPGPIKLHLASENMLDSLFEERLRSKDLLPFGYGGNMLLVETSYFNPPVHMDEMIADILSAGYFPILAHPERYAYMSLRDYSRYHGMGVRFQLNLPALSGSYGKGVKRKAEWLLKHGMYSMYGTDIHSLSSFKERISGRIDVKFQQIQDED